jgi:hypothetical protein
MEAGYGEQGDVYPLGFSFPVGRCVRAIVLNLARDEPRGPLQGHVGPGPLKKNNKAVSETDQKQNVDEDPDYPRQDPDKTSTGSNSLILCLEYVMIRLIICTNVMLPIGFN